MAEIISLVLYALIIVLPIYMVFGVLILYIAERSFYRTIFHCDKKSFWDKFVLLLMWPFIVL